MEKPKLYKEFKSRLNHFSNKVTFTDINGKNHFLYQKESTLNKWENLDMGYTMEDVLNLHESYNIASFDWIMENKPELLTKNK